jgi:hypothetical protein
MTTKTQQNEQEQLRAATGIIIRALILAAIVALVVSVAPIASAGTAKKPPSPTFIEIGTTETLDLNASVPKSGPS